MNKQLSLKFDNDDLIENEEYLKSQLITYLGNKRALLDLIEEGTEFVLSKLKKDKLIILDLFSGSGVVSRFFKKYSSKLISNDLEDYCYTLNKCYLTNTSEIDFLELEKIVRELNNEVTKNLSKGFISNLYSPKNDKSIKEGERVFYTNYNSQFIDTARKLIETIDKKYKHLVLAPLLTEASIKNNTSGVFKGFYKNTLTNIGQFGGNNKDALKRIKGKIELKVPVLSNFECNVEIYKEDANDLVKRLDKVDLVYIDPPYNQHPYSSNYFMLNLINNYIPPVEYSDVSGIPKDWTRSVYNKKNEAKNALFLLCKDIKSSFIMISYNSDGFIKKDEMIEMLNKLGKIDILEKRYNTFRGSRNLGSRDLHVKEYLFILDKR
jgi:adenine-specific DNA-methyltransferase